MPSVSGVTSRRRTSFTSPVRTAAWTAAPKRDAFHRIDAVLDFFADIIFDKLLHDRHARRAADQMILVISEIDPQECFGLSARILERVIHRSFAAVDDRRHNRFQLGPRELLRQMLRTRSIGRDEGQVELRFHDVWKVRSSPSRRILSGASSPACLCVRSMPDSLRNSPATIIDQGVIHVGAAQLRVAGGRHDFEGRVPPALDISMRVTSSVPPPRSKTMIFWFWPDLSRP